jgi:hypothetical protein
MVEFHNISLKDLTGWVVYTDEDRIKLLFQLMMKESDDSSKLTEQEAVKARIYDRNGNGEFDKDEQARFIASCLVYNELHNTPLDYASKYHNYNKNRIAEAIKQIRDTAKINMSDYINNAIKDYNDNPHNGIKINLEQMHIDQYEGIIRQLESTHENQVYSSI